MKFSHSPYHASLLIALGLPALAAAEDATVVDENMEVIVVTASRTETKLKDVTGSMSVFTGKEIENRKPIVASDILRSAPGVSVNRSGGVGSLTQVRVRGAESNHVLVLIDGVEANDISAGNEFNFANLLANDIGQVEVLRGPQSSLWGAGALAGVISITTKKSDTPFAVNGYLEGGSFDTYSAGLNLGGAGEKFNYRISAGYVDSEGENISREGDEKDGYTNKTLNLGAGYDFTDNVSLIGSYRHTEADRDFDGTDFNTALPIDADNNTEGKFDYASLKTVIGAFDRVWINEIGVNYNKSKTENFNERVLDTGTEGTRTRGYWQSSWLPGGDDNNKLTFVAERIHETFVQEVPDTSFGDANRDLSQNTTGLVGEYNHAWESGWKLALSARHDDNEDFKDANSYRAGLLYDRLEDGWQLRGSYGTGVKNPTFTERYGYYEVGGPAFIGNPDLKPETSKSWEVGTTLKTRNNFFRVDLTYFNERLEDEIDGFFYDVDQNATTAVNLDGTSKRDGAELASWFNFTDKLVLYLAYTYLDAREPEVDGRSDLEIRRPRHIASANLNYAFFNERGKLNINADYNGEQEDIFFGPPTYDERVTLDAYTLVSALVSFRVIDNLEIYARGENLLNKEYEEVVGFDGQSRAGYVGFRFDWSL